MKHRRSQTEGWQGIVNLLSLLVAVLAVVVGCGSMALMLLSHLSR
jgi:hypothetical protein